MAVSRHTLSGVCGFPWLCMVDFAGELASKARCSLSAVLQLGCLPKAGTCTQKEWSALAYQFFTHPFLLEPALPVPHSHVLQSACSPTPSLRLGVPPRDRVSQELWDLDQLVSGNLHCSEIHKEPWTLCNPQELHPRTPTGYCILHVFLANFKRPLYLGTHMARLCTHTATCMCKPEPERPASQVHTHEMQGNYMLGMHK